MVNPPFRKIIKKMNFLRYRFRYLINYIIIGFCSILLEILIIKYVLVFQIPFILKVGVGFLAGVFLAFILNAKLNFKVPKSKNVRTFMIFLIISIIALILNLVLINILKDKVYLGYSSLRFFTATIIFMLSYTAHRKITFDFVKRVGIAIYLNKAEDISKIYSKVRYYADFIHLDLIDKSLDKNAREVDISLISEVDKTWGLKKMLHIMSKKPSIWIKKLNKSVNVIIFHLKIDEPIEKVIKLCKRYNKKIGLVLDVDQPLESILPYLSKLNFVQVMGIKELGKSGQLFNPDTLDKVDKLNKLKQKYKFNIIFDGGVKPSNIRRINAKYIVSSSGLLLSQNPVKAFMELKTSSRYHYIDKELKKDLFDKIKKTIESIPYLKSGNIVGSFSESKGERGVDDIDIVIIIDKFSKSKFQAIVKKFETLEKELQSKYGVKIKTNPTLGPLKFNQKEIVFHIMIYDLLTHKLHCLKSPFTCYDWQRSKVYFKKPMDKIYSVKGLQPNYFFKARRNALEYLSEIRENRISYRVYNFKNNKVFEEKKYKEMDSRHRIEFSYHITKFLISNFLKMYYRENKKYPLNKLLERYFRIFPKNRKFHEKLIKKLYFLKAKRKFVEFPGLLQRLEFFIKDFESQFNSYFNNSTEIFFIRHAKTTGNIVHKTKGIKFLGRKTDLGIIKPEKSEVQELKDQLKEIKTVLSSPLKRCKQTLKLLTNKQPIIDDKLHEINYGEIDGMYLKDAQEKFSYLFKDWQDGKDPKFPNGENSLDVILRIKQFIKYLSFKPTLVCTHNVVLRSLIGSYFKIPYQEWFKISIPHFQTIKFIKTSDNKLYIQLTQKQTEEIFKNF